MKYSKCIGGLVKDQGAPMLSQSSFAKLMNVVYLEGKINGLMKASRKLSHTKEPKLLDLPIFDVQKELTKLTGNLEPKDFIRGLNED